MKTQRFYLAILVAAGLLFVIACGGGGGSNPQPPTPHPLAWSSIPFVTAEVGVAYSQPVLVTGGTAPYTFALGTDKPEWLTIDAATGTLSGTPTAPTSSNNFFALKVTDAKGASISGTTSFIVYPAIAVNLNSAPVLKVNTYSDLSYDVSGGAATGGYTLSTTGLPPGLTATVGTNLLRLSGAPTSYGTFNSKITISDSIGGKWSTDLAFVVKNALVVGSLSLSAVQGRPFNGSVNVLSGTPPYTFSARTMPFGLTMSSSGSISGTPFAASGTLPQSGYLQFDVTDSDNPPQSVSSYGYMSLVGPVTVLAGEQTVRAGEGSQTLRVASGGSGAITVTLVSGTLPPGMSITQHLIQGVPTQTGVFTARLQAEDHATPPQFADGTITITVLPGRPSVDTASLSPAVVGQAYSHLIGVSGGTAPYTWSLMSTLPAGMTLQNGLLQGTPTEAGLFSVDVRVTDSSMPAQTVFGHKLLSVHYSAAGSGRNDRIATASSPASSTSASISPYEDASATGPDHDYYKLVALAGNTVDIFVDPTWPLDSMLEIVDANGQRYKTCIDATDDAPDGSSGIIPDSTPTAFDDDCMNDDAVLGVQKQSHLQFKVPGSAGQTTTFYAHVFDWAGNARPDATYTMSITNAMTALVMEPFVTLTGMKGSSTGFWLGTPQGGTAPYNFALAAGSSPLPAGLTLRSDGYLSGTPTQAGQWAVTVQATDASQPARAGSTEVDILIAESITVPNTMPAAVTGVPYAQPFTISGGLTPVYVNNVTWSPTQCCVTLTETSLTGTPQYAGDFVASVELRYNNWSYVNRSFTLHVDPGPLTATAAVPLRAKVYNYYYLVVNPKGGSAPFTYTMTGTPPPGVILNTSTGELAGYPTQAGTYNVTLRVVDKANVSATPIPVTIVVEP